jgi:serine/threonine-protein kinase
MRHKAAAAVAALIVLSLLGGIGATAWQARAAEVHRREAEKRLAEVQSLARSFLFEIHDEIRGLEGSETAQRTIVRRAREYLGGLAQEAGDDASLLEELASGYERVGDVQGGPRSSLGDAPGALASWRQAEALRERLLALRPSDVGSVIALARAQGRLGIGLATAGSMREAAERARQARALLAGIAPDRLDGDRRAAWAEATSLVREALRLAGAKDAAAGPAH